MPPTTDEQVTKPYTYTKRRIRYVWFSMLAAVVCSIAFMWLYVATTPPAAFPITTPVTIPTGSSAAKVSEELQSQGVVRSATLLYVAILLFHDPGTIKAGAYQFQIPANTFAVARRITGDAPKAQTIALTFPEGITAAAMADIVAAELPDFDSAAFVKAARTHEGFLFPDTYYVATEIESDALIQLLLDTYEKKGRPILQSSTATLTEYELITLASILEREANAPESMKLVSGILHNRLAIDMPLQADATIEYVLSKPLSELTPEDLTISSPYNTYTTTGLPPTPIGNPGRAALHAAAYPPKTEYYYYITGNDGVFRYAKTYAGHQANIEQYLKE